MRFSVISSGSKANCTFLEGAGKRILIDCGLSCKQTEIRLRSLCIEPHTIDAIVITHEHSDHIHGVPTFSRKYSVPVFVNETTGKRIPKSYHLETIVNGAEFCVGAMRLIPFSIVHDAVDPVGYVAFAEGLKFAQATDLGRATTVVKEHLKHSHAIVLESNHDMELLRYCGYTWELKQRIASSYGHLSNDDSAALLQEVMHGELCHVVLAHLSENSNTPEHALNTHHDRLDSVPWFSLQCGSVREASMLFRVGEDVAPRLAANFG